MSVRRLLLRLLGGLLLVLLLLAVSLSGLLMWVVDTERGTGWSLRQLQHYVPALAVEGASGSWRRGVQTAALRFHTEELQIDIEQLHLAIAPRPWVGLVAIERLEAARVAIRQQPAPPGEPEPAASPIELPALSLPLRIQVAALRVDELSYQRDATTIVIAPLRATLALAGDRLRWQELVLGWEGRQLTTSGWLHLRDDYPLQADARLSDPALQVSAGVALSGDLAGLRLYIETAGPATAQIEAELDALDPLLPFWATAQLTAPLSLGEADADTTTFESAKLQVEGNMEAAAGELMARLTVPGYDAIALAVPLQWQAPMLTFQPQVELQLGAAGSGSNAQSKGAAQP